MRGCTVTPVLVYALAMLGPRTELQAQSDARGPTESVNPAIIERIRAEGLTRSRIADDLRYLADVIGPRLTGSPAMDKANKWAADRMRTYGLSDVRLESWYFGRGWEELSYSGRMTAPFTKPLVGRSVAWAGRTQGAQAGPAVFLDSYTLDGVKAIAGQVGGAWVLLDPAEADRRFYENDRPARWTDHEVVRSKVEVRRTPIEMRQEGEAHRKEFDVQLRLAELAARGIVRRSRYPRGALGPVESILGEEIPPEVIEPGGADPLPQVILADPDYALVYRNLRAGVPVTLEFELETRFVEDNPLSYNTIGDLPGTDFANEFVIIGAHLDSWTGGTGALDNGAGSVVALEAMRILATLGVSPRRTIRVGLWSGEEPERLDHSGLFGSVAYVKAHASELDRTSVYLNLDQGTGRIRGIWEQGNTAAASIIGGILKPLSDLGVVGLKPGFFVGSDAQSFADAGVPAFSFVHDAIDPSVYHTEFDTFDAVQIDDLKQAAVVVAVTAYHLAMRPARLPR